ncbi:hotdog fold thioesterase [Aurantibacter crassamenti]|uniref:PaaI family thioesterase n=1 Tax=Aurantibacter crassamenti TaxID=1837375 RepID=UPI001939BDDE|nr:hotdog fold thioesterase [Aurantibacter crassamenti]MBM1107425.1 hotdog fold thioesterase [Aurantibacter crassamenti]
MNEFQEKILKICNESTKNTFMETIGIEYVDVGENFLTAKMPVSPTVHQPDGVLHGGVTAALAESVGSVAAHVFLNGQDVMIRGTQITANHISSIKEGVVFATASAIHMGRTTQLWDIKVSDGDGKLISSCRLSTIALQKK